MRSLIGRYQMVLDPSEHTAKEYHGKCIAAADSLEALWNDQGWKPRGLSYQQPWHIRDTRLGKDISPELYESIINRIKGWNHE